SGRRGPRARGRPRPRPAGRTGGGRRPRGRGACRGGRALPLACRGQRTRGGRWLRSPESASRPRPARVVAALVAVEVAVRDLEERVIVLSRLPLGEAEAELELDRLARPRVRLAPRS